jgi:hypothetical protein
MRTLPFFLLWISSGLLLEAESSTTLPRTEWGAPAVEVIHHGSDWVIRGRKQTVTLDARSLELLVQTAATTWKMLPSTSGDLKIRHAAVELAARLADAESIAIVPFDSGAKTGVKLTLDHWKLRDCEIDLPLTLTVALEGADEELVFDITVDETKGNAVRQLDWPAALDAKEVDYTVLNHYRGILLPRNWPEAYNPIRSDNEFRHDTSEIQSDVIECWSQPWWGFQKGAAAMMVIVETPDDAAYQWSHPAGGPTLIGPRWRAQLGHFGYVRTARMVFFDHGNYVTLAKRYRAYAMETGLWVSLKEKITRSPKVESLIGAIESRVSVLRNIVPESRLFDPAHPEKNHQVHSFSERVQQLRALKTKGVDRFNLVLTGWPRLGYDRQHPDVLPVAPESGGYEGMRQLATACRESGYLFTLHDQYRDYYVDAPSYNPEFAVHEEDATGAPTLFPGTRFGSFKEGALSFLTAWDGGKQTCLNARFMAGHLKKNYAGIFTHDIHPDGSYLDVFGYVPPDQDFNPEHPTTRTEAKREIARVYRWARDHLGVVGTEAGADWTVPYTDYSSSLGPGKAGIAIPLFSLVYHDAVMTPYSPTGGEARMNRDDRPNWLYGMLNGGFPRIGIEEIDRQRPILDQMTALHRRVALLEMVDHEFLDAEHKKERTTFADGTTVTVDWNGRTVSVSPR